MINDIVRLIDMITWFYRIKKCNSMYNDIFMESCHNDGRIMHRINRFYFNYRQLNIISCRFIYRYSYRIIQVGVLSKHF